MNRFKFLSDLRGIAALEFALCAPVVILLLLGTTDIVLWLRTWLCMEYAASEMTQIITQYKDLYTSDFNSTFNPIVQATVGNASLACGSGGMVVTGIDNSSGTPKATWQWSSGLCVSSSFTKNAGSSTNLSMPGGYRPPNGLSAIVVELITTQPAFVFSKSIMGTVGISNISTYAVAIPRFGILPTLTPGTRPS